MSNSRIFCGGILLILVWFSSLLDFSHGVVTCKTDSNPCRCELSDGSRIVDLTELNNKGGKAFFEMVKQSGSQYFFSLNPCTAMKDPYPNARPPGSCKAVSVCQYNADSGTGQYEFDCGQPNPTKQVVNNEVQFVYKGENQGGVARTTTLTILCDENTKGTLSSFEEDSINAGHFKATLKTKFACLSPSSSETGGLSIGSILVIAFCVLIIVYIVAGILIMKFVKGAESVPEMIPNKSFWSSFPGLVKDGCIFFGSKVKACCSFLFGKVTGRGYQEM